MNASYQDLATPKLRGMLAALSDSQRKAMLQRLGKELEKQLKAHFLQRENDSPNKQGFPRSHFWNREVRARTSLREVTADRATVGIDSPEFRFKLTGGTIRPGPGRKNLAIALRGEVYGVLPRSGTIPGIFLVRTGGRLYLAARDGTALRIYWKLVPKVTVPADPRALPPVEKLQAALEARAELEMQRILQQTQ